MFTKFLRLFKLKIYKRYKLSIAIVAIIMLFPIITLGSVAQSLLQAEIESQVNSQLSESLKLVSYSIENMFSETEQIYNRIIINPNFIRSFQTVIESDEDNDAYDTIRINIADENYNASYISNISVLILDHAVVGQNIIYDNRLSPIDFDELMKDMPINGGWIGTHKALDDEIRKSSDTYVASLIGPIKDLSSNIIGYIVIDLDFDYVSSLFHNRFVDYNSELHLIAPDAKDLFTQYDIETATSTSVITEYHVSQALIDQLAKESTSINAAIGQYSFELVEIDDGKEFVAYQEIGKTGFTLLAILNYDEAMSSVGPVRIWTGVFMLIGVVLSILFATQLINIIATKDKLLISEERYRLTAEGANDVLWDWHIDEGELIMSKRWWDIMAYPPEENTSDNFWKKYLDPDDHQLFINTITEHEFSGQNEISIEVKMKNHADQYIWFLLKGKKVYNEKGDLSRLIGTLSDISTRKKQEFQLTYLAYHDPLTNLLNRNGMFIEIDKMLGTNPSKAGIIFLDLDNFKYINDTYGHDVGDKLLIAIGNYLNHLIGANSIVSRIGGDEFVVFVNNTSNVQLQKLSAKLLTTFNQPFDLGDFHCYTSVSIGISVYPDDGNNFTDLLRAADIAMYQAKDNGKNCYMFYNSLLLNTIVKRMHIEEKMRLGINNNEFFVVYQPQIKTETGQVLGYEALIRWKTANQKFISPGEFIPIAEETGLINELGGFVIEEALKTLSKLTSIQNPKPHMSINLSVHQITDDNLGPFLLETAAKYKVSSEQIVLEITETTLMEDLNTVLQKLDVLIEKGFQIALDDFGKGYSSLNYLRKLKIHVLKIDKDFIDDLMLKEDARVLAEFIIQMGKHLSLDIVAEGVETLDQYGYLLQEGCSMIQGYIFSKPLGESELFNQVYTNFSEKKAAIASLINMDLDDVNKTPID